MSAAQWETGGRERHPSTLSDMQWLQPAIHAADPSLERQQPAVMEGWVADHFGTTDEKRGTGGGRKGPFCFKHIFPPLPSMLKEKKKEKELQRIGK